MKILRFLIAPVSLAGAIFLSGCATIPAQVEETHLTKTLVSTNPFTLTAYYQLQNRGEALNIYIEGDGLAWRSRNELSSDPTPRHPVALELASEDPSPNVVYLARPCQYTPLNKDALCSDSSYWSNKRFSEEVISSVNQAIDHFVKENASNEINLIGYSGGAAVALLVAERRNDVASLRTVAGNVDPEAFWRYHGVSPLAGSLNPLDNAGKIRNLPQIHFVGGNDKIIPPVLVKNFIEKTGNKGNVQIVTIPQATHEHGWRERWGSLLAYTPPHTD